MTTVNYEKSTDKVNAEIKKTVEYWIDYYKDDIDPIKDASKEEVKEAIIKFVLNHQYSLYRTLKNIKETDYF